MTSNDLFATLAGIAAVAVLGLVLRDLTKLRQPILLRSINALTALCASLTTAISSLALGRTFPYVTRRRATRASAPDVRQDWGVAKR